jgi:hypothetical protein
MFGVLGEYETRAGLIQQLLAVADGAANADTLHASEVKALQRERDGLAAELRREKVTTAKEIFSSKVCVRRFSSHIVFR